MKYLSLFTGVGGFEIGINKAFQCEARVQTERPLDVLQPTGDSSDSHLGLRDGGWTSPLCIGFSEIDKYASQVLKYRFPNIKNYGDVTRIPASELTDFDLLVGGFPCQAFSVAGLRKGFDDTRGTLFFEIARILRDKRPRYFLLENVKGLLSHDSGKTFQTILGVLTELGYDTQWAVLNSKNFGVPQNRERVFFAGCLTGWGGREVFSFGEGNSETALKYVGQTNATDRVGDGKPLSRNAREGYRVYSDEGVAPALRSQIGGHAKGSQIIQLNNPTHSNNRLYGEDGVSPALNTAQGGNRQPKIAPTIRAEHHNTADVHYIPKDSRIRRLTPTECERLQGFPDGWTEYGVNEQGEKVIMSDTQRYKMMGNAVTTNAVAWVVGQMFYTNQST